MAAEEESSCCEEFGVMDRVVYEVIYRDLGRSGMNELDQLLSYVFLHDSSYNACINSPFQMKSNQIKIHRVHLP